MAAPPSRQSQQYHDVFAPRPRPQAPTLPIAPSPTHQIHKSIQEHAANAPVRPMPDTKSLKSVPPTAQPLPSPPIGNPRLSRIPSREGSPWGSLKVLGTLIQSNRKLTLCYHTDVSEPMLVKVAKGPDPRRELDMLEKLQHQNIIKIKQAFLSPNASSPTAVSIGFEYHRYTLLELKHADVPFQEVHIRSIASAVWISPICTWKFFY